MESGLKESAGGFGLNLGLLEMWICNSQICFFVPNPQDKQAQFFKVGSTVLFFFFFFWVLYLIETYFDGDIKKYVITLSFELTVWLER